MHPLDSILNDWRRQAAEADFSRTRDMGTAFERLCKAFLIHDPQQAAQFSSVNSYAVWARQKGLPATDAGIDLVAELRDEPGSYAAIQCKFRGTGGSIPRGEITSFLAESGSEEFRRRVWIDTTGRPWSRTAEDTLRRQEKPVQRIGLHHLKTSSFDWAKYVESGDLIRREPPKTPRPHQMEAIDAIAGGLACPGTRGKVLMACGTGKTLVAQRAAERLAGPGGRVLVLVPSLALLSQTLQAWLDDAAVPVRAFAVCSDSQTGRQKNTGDMADMDVLDLAFPATTNAEALAARAMPSSLGEMTVVFATYQSSPVVEAAQAEHGLPVFDFAVADEAHRTAGALLPDDDLSAFVRIHDNDRIRADRRLYMTATPKVYAESARTRAGEFAGALCSMDDEGLFGPMLHEIQFGKAVDDGLLADYRVIVLTVPQSLAADIRIAHYEEGAPLTIDEHGKMIGCLRALAKVDAEEFPESDRAPMRRAIAFCNRIESSKRLEGRIADVADEYRAELWGEAVRPVAARHVDGSFSAHDRNRALKFLEAAPEGETRILTNARCLTEGVDVPALDGILFMHPRKSQIEVVQAVGRVMRQSEGKEWGYIVLPVVVPDGGDAEQALSDNERWRGVWQMLNAIRSHDERFEAMINLMEAGEPGARISILTLADWRPAGERGPGDGAAPDPDGIPGPPVPNQGNIFEGLPAAIRTRIVEKCGNKRYWDEWAGDVADIARAHIARIRAIVDSGEPEKEVFGEFLDELRDDLNPQVTEDDAIKMLAQHMVTQPVFEALFGGGEAAERNPVGRGMQTMLEVLEPAQIGVEAESLDPFYESVRARVAAATTAEARQRIVAELYDKFFRGAFPRVTERLGVVYTPVEIVDFILHSAQHVMKTEFGCSLGNPGVHILDPFTGTGTFMTRLLQSGLLSPDEVRRKYGAAGGDPELHANELVLLAYYIASVNIETAFMGATGEGWEPFGGICLTDTFALHENDDRLAALFPENSDRRKRQKGLDIRVVVGNPPWSAGQRSAADNNRNASYPALEQSVRETYAARSGATNRNSLYDSYKMAIRWASNRIEEKGIVAFVTNGSWLEGNADAGLRACLAKEFTSIHVLNLRGNQRTAGERSRREGGKIFGSGSRAPVAVMVLVRNRNPDAPHEGCRIRYRDIGDYLKRERKLELVSGWGSIAGIEDWREIEPDEHHDWIGKRDDAFADLMPLGTKEAKAGRANDALFGLYSKGLATGRDPWIYNFSRDACAGNARRMVQDYRDALRDWNESGRAATQFADIVAFHSDHVRWDAQLTDNLRRGKDPVWSPGNIWTTQYRPFVKQRCYVDYLLVSRKYQQDSIFPHDGTENRAICVPGIGSTKSF